MTVVAQLSSCMHLFQIVPRASTFPAKTAQLFVVVLCLAWCSLAHAADIEVTTAETSQQSVPQDQSLRVQGSGSVTTNTLDTPAIVGSSVGEGGNTVTLESGAVVQTTRPDDDTSDKSYGIRVYGTQTNNGVVGLAGGGPLAGGASNIVDVQSGSSISTTGKEAVAIKVEDNNRIDIGGEISTSGYAGYGIFAYSNNEINVGGTITNTGEGGMGIISYFNSKITLDGSITTSGVTGDGIDMGLNNLLTINGSINTGGNNALGLHALNDNFIILGGSVTTAGAGAHAIQFYEDNNSLVTSGTISTTGTGAYGLYTRLTNNVAHVSGSISATGANAYALYSGSSGEFGESNTFHLLGGAALTGGIHNADSDDGNTSYLTFGYATDGSNKADLTAVDNAFNLSLGGSITSTSSGRWDGYLAGGTTSLNGDENVFRNVFVGASSFDNAAVPDGPDGAGGMLSANLAAIGGASATLNVAKSIATSGTVSVGDGSTYNLAGVHTHTGTNFNVVGSGILDLANGGELINNAAGGAQNIANLAVSAGTGTLSGNDGLESVTNVNVAGTLNYNIASALTINTVDLNGILNNNSASTLTLSTFNVANGDTASIAGAGAGTVSLGNSNVNGDLTATRTVETTGTFALGADDTYNLSATHTHTGTNFTATGTLNLDGGSLVNNAGGGAQTIGTLVVENGKTGSLSGSAATGVTTANIDGTLELSSILNAAGGVSSSGTLAVFQGSTGTIGGDYTQLGSGAAQLGVASAVNYGQLNVTGTADLSASNLITVNVPNNDTLVENDLLNGVLSAGTLVVDAGALTVRDNVARWRFVPTVVGNRIDLTVERYSYAEAVGDSSQVSSGVASGAAAVLDDLDSNGGGTADMTSVLNEMGGLDTGDAMARAVGQTVSNLGAAFSQIGFDLAGNGATQLVQSRIGGLSGLSSGDAVFEDRYFWMRPFYSRTDQGRRNGVDGYVANSYGLGLGADARITRDWRIGAAFSYGTAGVESDSDTNRERVDVDTWQTTLYATNEIAENLDLNLIGAFGLNKNDSSRHIVIGALNRTANAEYDSRHYLLDAELVNTYQVNDALTLAPAFRLKYIHIDVDGYTETGAGALNLSVQDASADSLVASIGAKLGYRMFGNQKITADADVGYDLLARPFSLVSTYSGGGPSFVVRGNDPEKLVYRAGLGYELTTLSGMEIAARYGAEAREDLLNQSGSMEFRFPF